MARSGPYTIHTKKDGQPYAFNTVASSEAEAKRIFRASHPRWHIVSVEGPAFPAKGKGS